MVGTFAISARSIPRKRRVQARCQTCGQLPSTDVLLRGGADGYGVYRLIRKLGHDCIVAAPSLIPEETWRSG